MITDHKPLQWLFSLKEPNSKLVRQRLKLEEYDYEIIYKKGKLSTNADALTRIQINHIGNTNNPDNIEPTDNPSVIVNFDSLEELPFLSESEISNILESLDNNIREV